MAIRAGGESMGGSRWEGDRDISWNNPFYTGCMGSCNTGIPIIYIDFHFSFYLSSHMQSSTAFFVFFCLLPFYESV